MRVEGLSGRFEARRLTEANVDQVLGLYLENPQYFLYARTEATRRQVLSDMRLVPPGVDASRKHFVGLFMGPELVSVLDIVEGYPTSDTAYLGLFMVRRHLQATGLARSIIREAEAHLKAGGICRARLAINADNPQATRFWRKCGYVTIRELTRNGVPILEAEHAL